MAIGVGLNPYQEENASSLNLSFRSRSEKLLFFQELLIPGSLVKTVKFLLGIHTCDVNKHYHLYQMDVDTLHLLPRG